jgi:hypothetical protein
MIRNLKALMLAAMAVLAMSAVAAQGAQAHTPALFHSELSETTITALPDETAGTKTAHHVIDINNNTMSITCNSISADSVSTESTPTTITLDNFVYNTCTFNGQSVTININGCHYQLHADGHVDIAGCDAGKVISYTGNNCTVEIGEQSGLTEVTYHAGPLRNGKKTVTLEAHVTGIAYTASGTNCTETGAKTDGNYTTGNTIVTGSKKGSVAAADIVNIEWTATIP